MWFHFALEIVQEQITPAGTKGKHFVYERTSSMICNTIYEVNYFALDVCCDLGEADTATSWPVVRGVPGFSLCLCSRFMSWEKLLLKSSAELPQELLELRPLQGLYLDQRFFISTFACFNSA